MNLYWFWFGLIAFGAPALIPTGLVAWAYTASGERLREWLSVWAVIALPLSIATVWLLVVSNAHGAVLVSVYAAALVACASSVGVATALVWRRAKALGRLAWGLLLILFVGVAGVSNMIAAVMARGVAL